MNELKNSADIDRLIDIGRQENPDLLGALNHGHLAALPDHIKLHDIEKHLRRRVRFRAQLRTTSIQDFSKASLMTQGDNKTCFIDPEEMTAKTIFNLGNDEFPGHGDHHISLSLKKTAAFEAILKINGAHKSQKELAEWIEEWRPFMTAQASGEDMPLNKAITAVRTVKIEANQTREVNTGNFNTERSDLEKIEAKARDGALPEWLIFTCTPYLGLGQRDFYLRLSLLTSAEPKFVLRIIQLEQHAEEIAEEFRQLLISNLSEGLGDDAPAPELFIGTIAL